MDPNDKFYNYVLDILYPKTDGYYFLAFLLF
jgi:hypothetical protein